MLICIKEIGLPSKVQSGMEHVNILRQYGLFDAKVPRYTSYPPANRFGCNTGARVQGNWLSQVPKGAPISVYVHIPFCRRLCWFCACRTQGTRTMQPVDAYVTDLMAEVERVAVTLPGRHPMARLHLGGGTPTLLTPHQMGRLIDKIDQAFDRTEDFEFSVEIDPTEAAAGVLALLAARGMRRASIGVQDFAPKVQAAIGRDQSHAQTREVVTSLREHGIASLNIDLLYGLPFQTNDSLMATLGQVLELGPDRLALYGYAHVPHMSKRQVMIPGDALPDAMARFQASGLARKKLTAAGFDIVGIDHFALPSDSLSKARQNGRLKRNFQGYTDDPCDTLIGFGASAISKFPQGFLQNAVATAAYQHRIRDGGLGGHKGYVMSPTDLVISDMVDQIMCHGHLDPAELSSKHPSFASEIRAITADAQTVFEHALKPVDGVVQFRPGTEGLARVVAAHIDIAWDASAQNHHSSAI